MTGLTVPQLTPAGERRLLGVIFPESRAILVHPAFVLMAFLRLGSAEHLEGWEPTEADQTRGQFRAPSLPWRIE